MGKRFIVGLAVCTLLTVRSTDMPLTNDGVAKCFNGGLIADTLYAGLHSGEPTRRVQTPRELSGTGYARVEVAPRVNGRYQANVAFLECGSGMGRLQAAAAWGDPTLYRLLGFAQSGGNLIAWSTIPDVESDNGRFPSVCQLRGLHYYHSPELIQLLEQLCKPSLYGLRLP